ncbi:hypothetical protein JQ582_14225 [Bradyrhizobium japonicum]|jgi:hypothetical protein|uniref:DUF5680 domain-containing protein n=1 Tax=Bradyrhizobium japonicum TaxID=375 RepID=UPI000456A26E|nr:DUF5680 domain-containing protein [Bradyrhizobium japonicum]AHY49633.1 putative sorbitol dehydrogenase [Bradyrhizobium japonicum SEMIA 5079]MBR0745090.1 hypothetical protein [Bradyrhizobium japonicum]MCD9110397.1 DUF5680 domain-containing protein [Bradyrhizobium japonicum]MCD9257973.1 DUF5680 domain-containing protein [Bradyrhizobium japonicum SEMIA 5079]MCD9822483.1 DUF5680 domain-containing protein [Bradyrhizobium japonicum]
MPSVPPDLAAFLVEAKRRTYAGLDDDATVAAPLLAGSKQLEHRAPPYAYRDIYFGMGFFVGQETVSRDDRVIWSMSYSGGARADITDRPTLLEIYKFLRQALLGVSVEEPYRGPRLFEQAGMTYRNEVEGTLDRFHGIETIARHDGAPLYELRYSGGLLR